MSAALWKKLALSCMGLFVLLQLVPYGRNHTNPAVRREPRWDSPTTRELARRACFDCHSNETVWPWYAHVAPASFLVQNHVDHGREHLNFSEWDRPQKDADEAADAVIEGWMPLAGYVPLHPEARLTPAEARALAEGLTRTIGPKTKERDHDPEHDEH